MRKLLFIPLFFLLSLCVSIFALQFTVNPNESQVSQAVADASSISRDRISQITADIVEEKFKASLIETNKLDVDSAIAESDTIETIGELSDNAVTRWLGDQASAIDVSAIRDQAQDLSVDALSAVRSEVEKLEPCQVDSEFAGLENANCNPGDFELDQEIARLSQELLTGNSSDGTVEPPWWMRLLGSIYDASNGSAANFVLISTLLWAGLIVISYGNPVKGLGGLGRGLMWQALIIGLGALAALLISSFTLRLLGLDDLVESVTLLSGLKIWQQWQAAVLVIAAALFVIALGLRFLSKLRVRSHDKRDRRSHTGHVMHDQPQAPVLDQQLESLAAADPADADPLPPAPQRKPRRRPRQKQR